MENELETVIQILDRTPGHRRSIAGAPDRSRSTVAQRARLAHPSSTHRAVRRPDTDTDIHRDTHRDGDSSAIDLDLSTTAGRPALRLVFSDGRRLQPVGA